MGTEYYDEHYFAYQKALGEFGGWANLGKFERYIRPDLNVVDFGCGGGYLLKRLRCKDKIGVEINEAARSQARSMGITVYASSDELDDEWADLIISDNALEHCLYPLKELQALHPKLRRGGRVVFVVPCEAISHRYVPHDINHHLYSWSPMSAGNLFTEAGFAVEESTPYIHKWPVGYRTIARTGGRRLFDLSCRVYGQLERSWFQVRIVAHRE